MRRAASGERIASFGNELRQERESRGVELAAIAAGTKVSERYLRALEAENFKDLPGGIFNKGIVRGYCRHLGLDETEWLERYSTSFESAEGEQDWSAFAENVKANRLQAGASSRRWWGLLLMALAVAALAWACWHYVLKHRLSKPRTDAPVAFIPAVRGSCQGRGGSAA